MRKEIIEYERPEVKGTVGDQLMAEIDAEMEVEEGMQRLAKISKEEAKAKEENKEVELD